MSLACYNRELRRYSPHTPYTRSLCTAPSLLYTPSLRNFEYPLLLSILIVIDHLVTVGVIMMGLLIPIWVPLAIRPTQRWEELIMAALAVVAIAAIVRAIATVGSAEIPIGVPGRHFLPPPPFIDCGSACLRVSWRRRL